MRAQIVKISNAGEKVMEDEFVLDESRALDMYVDYILNDPGMDDYVKEEYAAYACGEDDRGRKQRIGWLVKNGKISETSVTGKYSLYLYIIDEDDREIDEYYTESRKFNEKRKRGLVKESYEVSPELADRLNSILADEFLASEAYRLAIVAMKGNKQHRLTEIAEKNGEDELEDHFKNLYEWMQSKGIKVVTDRDEMAQITNGTILKFTDGMSTKEIVDQLILSEEEAIDIYEDTIPHTELDLNTMLCGFLNDEREHLKELVDCRDEMGGGDKASEPKHKIYEDRTLRHKVEPNYEVYKAVDIDWDVDDEEDLADLPAEVEVEVPRDVISAGEDAVEEYVSDAITDETGFCHNGFYLKQFSKPVGRR